jgi:uncharacterized alpha-E superfamily protein
VFIKEAWERPGKIPWFLGRARPRSVWSRVDSPALGAKMVRTRALDEAWRSERREWIKRMRV